MLERATGRAGVFALPEDHKLFASNNRLDGTPDENRASVQGSIAYFGTYTVNDADHTLTFHIERCTFRIGTGPIRSES
jgi:hypothetical protein